MFLLHFLAYLVMYLKTEDETLRRMLLVFYMGQVVFSCLHLYLPVYLQECVKTSGKLLYAPGLWFYHAYRLSLDKGLDKAFKQFVIVAAAAILSWLVPFIMERFWQLYKFQWVYAGSGWLRF